MLRHIFAQSALLYALLFVIINIYSVYSIYFGVGYFAFIQGYIIYKKVCFQVGSEIKSSIISQISFVKGQRMVFTKLSEQLDTLQILLANLCWLLKSLAKDFFTDLFIGVGINQKIEVGRTVNCRKHNKISVVSVFRN